MDPGRGSPIRRASSNRNESPTCALALAVHRATALRITRFGRQHVRDGKITFTQYKGRNRNPKQLTLPILPVLQRIISASPCGDLTFLVNDLGRAFTDAGFGNKFREWCDQA